MFIMRIKQFLIIARERISKNHKISQPDQRTPQFSWRLIDKKGRKDERIF